MKENAQKVAFEVIDGWLDYKLRHQSLPGLQVAIRSRGRLVFDKAYGYANVKTGRKLSNKDLFHIASHSKMFTSCALLMLQEDGKLSLGQAAIDFLPELAGHRDIRFKNITIRDLVSNRSGIFRDGVDSAFWDLQKPFLHESALLAEVLSADLIYAPNTKTKYSNIGFSLLGLIIGRASNTSYQTFVETRILAKLPETEILFDYQASGKWTFADGHLGPFKRRSRQPLKHTSTAAMASATGFCANAVSISAFLHELLGGHLLSEKARLELQSLFWPIPADATDQYGLGLIKADRAVAKTLGHSGGFPGFSTVTARWAEEDLVISVLLNSNEESPELLLKSILQILQAIEKTFSEIDLSQVIVTEPMLNFWFRTIYVVGKTKVHTFNIESWTPCENQTVLEVQDDGSYISNTENGYYNPGEKVVFFRDDAGQVSQVRHASYTNIPESAFEEKMREAFA